MILGLRDKYGRDDYSETAIVGHSMTFLVRKKIFDRLLTNFAILQTEGYETSSTTMSCTLFEMALNPDIQKRVQEEVDTVLAQSKGEFTEEVIAQLTYLEQCIMETVRLHCPVFHLSKLSLKEVDFPPQYENSAAYLKVEEGMNVVIPVYALHQ